MPRHPKPTDSPAHWELDPNPVDKSLALPSDPNKAIRPRPRTTDASLQKYIDCVSDPFIESLGADKDLKTALHVSSSPKAKRFLRLLLIPRERKLSISRMAAMADLIPVELAQIFRDYYSSQAVMQMVKQLPEVADDIMEDAKSTEIECPRCDGWGKITLQLNPKSKPARKICPRCDGLGKGRQVGNSDAPQLALEATGAIR